MIVFYLYYWVISKLFLYLASYTKLHKHINKDNGRRFF